VFLHAWVVMVVCVGEWFGVCVICVCVQVVSRFVCMCVVRCVCV